MPLKALGMDEKLSTHFAHLFIRDPLVIFEETLEEPPEGKADHFEVLCPNMAFSFLVLTYLELTINELATYAF
jgi:hypothetical protein